MVDSERYVGKPFLVALEKYVIWSIGELTQREAEAMDMMTPPLRRALNESGTWQQVIASFMGFSPDLQAALREMWQENLEIARQNNAILTPEEFAQMVVDKNFPIDDED